MEAPWSPWKTSGSSRSSSSSQRFALMSGHWRIPAGMSATDPHLNTLTTELALVYNFLQKSYNSRNSPLPPLSLSLSPPLSPALPPLSLSLSLSLFLSLSLPPSLISISWFHLPQKLLNSFSLRHPLETSSACQYLAHAGNVESDM